MQRVVVDDIEAAGLGDLGEDGAVSEVEIARQARRHCSVRASTLRVVRLAVDDGNHVEVRRAGGGRRAGKEGHTMPCRLKGRGRGVGMSFEAPGKRFTGAEPGRADDGHPQRSHRGKLAT